jgi:hypothetical protein
MLNSPRWLLALVSVSFATFHAVLGALSWKGYDDVWMLALSIAIYLTSVGLAVGLKPGLQMGPGAGAIAATGGVATSIVANLGITNGQTGTYASWYVGGMGVLFGIVAIRGQARLSWLAALLVTFIVIQEAGVGAIGPSGLVGMVVLIAAGQATARSLARADREVQQLQETEIQSRAAIVSAEAAGVERRERLQNVLTKALPALSYITSTKGRLTAEQREKLLRLEAGLRDDIRGRHLINDDVRAAAQAARERGVEVMLLDEGGLDQVSDPMRKLVLDKIVVALGSVTSGKIVVRSPKGENWLVTVAATRPGTNTPDLWLRF